MDKTTFVPNELLIHCMAHSAVMARLHYEIRMRSLISLQRSRMALIAAGKKLSLAQILRAHEDLQWLIENHEAPGSSLGMGPVQ